MSGRMGTSVDAIFGPGAMLSLLEAADSGASSGGIRGTAETDQKGRYYSVLGAGEAEIGMFFVSEGTEPSDPMISRLLETCAQGILVVIDREICELAIYIHDGKEIRVASALMSERSDPYCVAVPHILLGDLLAIHYVGYNPVEQEQCGILEYCAQWGDPAVAVGDPHDYADV